jgi:hypothetical protein
MGWTFETLGNAMIQISKDGAPVLVTDPWLFGSAYFGSWELERALNEAQLERARASRYIWFSHGHPDHFHIPSVETLRPTSQILLPDHYNAEMAEALAERGFNCRILPQKKWVELEPGLRILCVANENMDAIAAFEVDGALLLNKNDSPFCGEDPFFRKLISGYDRSFLFSLCACDADMINTFDERMECLTGAPDERKPGTVWDVARTAQYLGVKRFCCSSSQHIYARPDSAWANTYRLGWREIQKLWTAPEIPPIPPYSLVDIASGTVIRTDADDLPDPATRIDQAAGEDWEAPLSEAEWVRVERFARQFETLKAWQDFIAFTVGGERRTFLLKPSAAHKPEAKRIGVNFHVPRASLLETIELGYFDDLLIGNFMKTQLFGMSLYPLFSPRVAKLGGNARVFTARQLWAYRWHFLRQSPVAFLRFRRDIVYHSILLPSLRILFRSVGLFGLAKRVRQRMVGAPSQLL